MCFEPITGTIAATSIASGAAAGTALTGGAALAATGPLAGVALTGAQAAGLGLSAASAGSALATTGLSMAPTVFGSTALGSLATGIGSAFSMIPGGAGTLLNGVSSIAMMSANNAQAEHQARLLQIEAQREEVARRLRLIDREREFDKQRAAAKARFGMSGVDPTMGTAVDVLADFDSELAFANFADNFNSEFEVSSKRSSAGIVRSNASTKNTGIAADFGRSLLDITPGTVGNA